MTSQWAQPTVRNFTMRVCAMNSLSIVNSRGKKGWKRPGAGWPCAIVRAIRVTPRPKLAQQTRLIAIPMRPKVIVVAFNDATSPFVGASPVHGGRRAKDRRSGHVQQGGYYILS